MRRLAYNNTFRCELTINRKIERTANTMQESSALNDIPRNARRNIHFQREWDQRFAYWIGSDLYLSLFSFLPSIEAKT